MHRLSCTRCKERKVRCNRVAPRCNHCVSHNAACVYPERVKRQPLQKPAAARASSDSSTSASVDSSRDDAALESVLQRLQRLEQTNQQLPPPLQQHYTPPSNAALGSAYSTISSPPVATPALSDGTTSLSAGGHISRLDVTAVIFEAIDQVRQKKQKRSARDMITGKVYVPPELARTWINMYLATMATDIFPSLINQKLIRIMPDIIFEPYIHIDISLQVLFYVVCFHGYMLAPSVTQQERDYAYSCYVGCLRSIPQWKKEATASPTDFAAAMLLCRIATAMFDYDVAWDMHKLTNEFARARNLQNLDDGVPLATENLDDSNDHRRGFWYLIQVDLYIRLLMDKPPTITADKWQVNMPWLNSSPESEQPDEITAIGFIISSRITMILMRFFTLMDNPARSSRAKLLAETEELCHEIEHIFTDWKALEIFSGLATDSDDLWVLVDCLITGYTSIIFMMRKVDITFNGQPHTITRDAQLPSHPLVLNASRHILRISQGLMTAYPNPDMVSSVFGAYQLYVAIARLYIEAIRDPDGQSPSRREDLQILESFSKQVLSTCRGNEDLYPFVRAINHFNELVKDKAV